MKVDFTKPLLNYKGELLKDQKGQNILVKDMVCNALSTVTEATKEDKQALDLLTKMIWSEKKEVELSPEDLVLIRKNIEHFPASLFAQIYKMLS